jgi:hypothetical protein
LRELIEKPLDGLDVGPLFTFEDICRQFGEPLKAVMRVRVDKDLDPVLRLKRYGRGGRKMYFSAAQVEVFGEGLRERRARIRVQPPLDRLSAQVRYLTRRVRQLERRVTESGRF